MIESRSGAKTPKLDQLKTDIVLGLQELQDQVAKHGRLWNFAYESRLRWDDSPYTYWIEWDPRGANLSFISGDDTRRDGCVLLGYWLPEYSESLSIWPSRTFTVEQTIQDWTNIVLGQIDARTLINLLRCDMIPSDIELGGLGLSLMDMLSGVYQWGGGGRFSLHHTMYTPVVETILSYYLLEVGSEITDCKVVQVIAEWLSVVRNQGPGTQRFLELVAQL